MKFLKDFIILLKARYPIIYISTSEEERIEYLLKYSSKKYSFHNMSSNHLLNNISENNRNAHQMF